jgi:hypothetical protein
LGILILLIAVFWLRIKNLIMAFDFEAGEILLLDKPLTWTSFDLVKKVRNYPAHKKDRPRRHLRSAGYRFAYSLHR